MNNIAERYINGDLTLDEVCELVSELDDKQEMLKVFVRVKYHDLDKFMAYPDYCTPKFIELGSFLLPYMVSDEGKAFLEGYRKEVRNE